MDYETLAKAEKLVLFAINSPVEGIGFLSFSRVSGTLRVICTHLGAVWVQSLF